MFRLVDDAFSKNNELHKLSVHCLTETIKSHLINFFEEGYEQEDEQNLYKKVRLEEAYKLFPEKLLNSMTDVDISSFIPKKMAQFMLLLDKKEEETPDIFLEYILYRMMVNQSSHGYDFMPSNVSDKKNELKKLLRAYAKDELCIDDVKERNKYVKDRVILLTQFTSLLGVDEPDDDSLAFWDWDYSFFDDFGFEKFIKELAYGYFVEHGYGLEYTKSIFTKVNEKIPCTLT